MLSSLFTLASAIAVLTGNPATNAGTAQQLATEPGSCAAAEVAIHRHAASPGELEAVRGQYTLADGRILSVAPRARSLMADIGEGPAQRLYAVAHQVYRTSDGTLELSFTTDDNGQVSSVRVAQRVAR
jgi:zona occludens toxin (predicted ATPase)